MRLIEVRSTADGSPTLLNTELGSTYHSDHGAVQESMHVFIGAGLENLISVGKTSIRIFEMGFGSGLNALLTLRQITGSNVSVDYIAVEKFPVTEAVISDFEIGLPDELKGDRFKSIHSPIWSEPVELSENFKLTKIEGDLLELTQLGPFNLIYYDAFEPRTQPELWTPEVFQKLVGWMEQGGVLVTYCAKGQVRRDLQSAGFELERLSGPPGKREMIRATKR